VSPVRYEVGVYITEDDILHSHRCENLKSYIEYESVERVSLSAEIRTRQIPNTER
jgi:hypothetical protein